MKTVFLILVPLLFGNVTTLNECKPCECCTGGASRCQTYTSVSNYCIDGCTGGYFDVRCTHACINNCLICSGPNTCTECNDGYYGAHCNKCPDNCFFTCSNKDNCSSCKDGFYSGREFDDTIKLYYGDCRYKCKDNCTSCTSYNTCTKCKAGFYNTEQNIGNTTEHNDCYQQCRSNCKSCSSYDNCTECIDGKFNDVYSNCSESCNSDCKVCVSYDNCTECVDGKYNSVYSNCTESCNKYCKACTSFDTCTECADGRYNNIYNNCSENCSSDCSSCVSNDNCSSCKSGKYGTSCHRDCGIGCENDTCDFYSSECSCIQNFEGCKCDRCVHGKYGPNCNMTCPVGCLNSSCDTNGTCHSCKAGFTGDICKKCIRGKYGNDCISSCSIGCLNNACDINGTCLSCKSGFNGTKCNKCVPRKYGPDCNTTCPSNCKNSVCKKNGECNTCRTGFTGNSCERCGYGYYGSNCDILCSTQCEDTLCKRNGDCYSCMSGYSGNNCNQRDNAVPQTGGNIEVIIGATASGGVSMVLTILVIIAVVLLIKRKRSGKSEEIDMTEIGTTFSPNYLGQIDTCNTGVDEGEEIDSMAKTSNYETLGAFEVADTYYSVAAMKEGRTKVEQLQDFVSKKTNVDFADEFQQLPRGLIKPYADSQRRENLAKNRYKGIYPYDVTRVLLKDCSSDYINASYLDGYNKRKAYIASIGPTFRHMGGMFAFWIMVWQEKVGKIVMLTNLNERGLTTCDQYWPEKGFSLIFANIQVTSQTEETYADYTVRSFTVQKDSEKRTIFQVNFTAWPDKGIPDDVTSLIDFRQRVNNIKTIFEGPILVHCSTGIGRTGTYIALDSLTEEGEAEGEVDIYAFVRNMREQRVNMVQSVEQYQYLHYALVHTLTFDSKAVEASRFEE